MDVAVITDEISQNIDEALAVMARCDVHIAEIRAVWDTNCVDLDEQSLERLRQSLVKAGVSVCGIASPFFKCDLFQGEKAERGRMHQAREVGLDEQMALLERCFDVAETLGTNRIRVFSFWRKGDPTPEIEDRIVEMFQEPVARAEARGMELLLENEHSCYLGSAAETVRVLERLPSPAIAAVWDPGNAFCAGEVPFPDGYDIIRPHISHIHVKDAVRGDGGDVVFCKVGEGALRYEEHVQKLKADGYDGILSLETHYAVEQGGKAAASEESLLSLAAMVRGN